MGENQEEEEEEEEGEAASIGLISEAYLFSGRRLLHFLSWQLTPFPLYLCLITKV